MTASRSPGDACEHVPERALADGDQLLPHELKQ